MNINVEEQAKYRFRIGKDYSGKYLKMTLIKKQECEGKKYDLYTVCKVIDNGVEEPDFIPLYKETFTPTQVEEFYNPPVRQNSLIGGQVNGQEWFSFRKCKFDISHFEKNEFISGERILLWNRFDGISKSS